MTDILKDLPAYKWMTDDARTEGLEKGREEGRAEGREKGREEGREQEREEERERLRAKIVEIVKDRFPKLERAAKKQISDIKSRDRLLNLALDLYRVSTQDDALRLLFALEEEEQEAQ